ncbi:PAS domain-containing protein [Nostoc sp. CHAB 5834]|nr:PAS domain-containing protein [Nostoc sp. CHAB 5834]
MLANPDPHGALQQSQERFQAAIEAVEGILWTNDATGQMVGIQPGWTALTGQTQDQYQGYGWAAAVHPDDRQATIRAWQQAVTERRLFLFEHRLRLVDGTWGLFSIRAVPVLEADGSIREWVGVHTNITRQRQAERALSESEERYRLLSIDLEQQVHTRTLALAAANQELESANQLLQQSNENLQAFAYVASHDLQEPLRKIQSFGELLKNQYAAQLGEGRQYVERMQAAAGRMSTLITDLLNFSRLSAEPIVPERLRLNGILELALRDLDFSIEETGAHVQIDPLPEIMGDPAQLGQLFQNLISNALKFRQPGIAPAVHIRARQVLQADLPASVQPVDRSVSYHQIDIADNGIGFDQHQAEVIFQLFQRLHGRSRYRGTGIGLAIARKVVLNHGGAITATSQPGQGTTFSVYLPQP